MAMYAFTEAQIEAIAPSTFERGWGYFHDGAVLHITERGDQLFAEVQGSDDESYHVHVQLSDDGIETWLCSCPYEWDGACKHVVAALLTVLHTNEEVAKRPPLDSLLAYLDATQLQRIVLALVAQHPALADVVEQAAQQLKRPKPKRRTP